MNSINSISIKALRSPIDNSSDSLIRFMRGDSLNFRVAIFSDEDTLESLDDILSLRFEIYDIGNYQSPSPRTFSRLILKSIGAQELNASLSIDDWNNGESQHATFNLSAEESSIEYGEKWLKISAEVETDKFVTVSAGWIEVEENASAYPDTIITDVEAWTSEAQEYAQTAQSAAQEALEIKEDLNEISTQIESIKEEILAESALDYISTASEQASIATEKAQAAAESATQAAACVEAVSEALETVNSTNLVTISGTQTISGKKVFSSPVSIGTTNTISGTNTLVVGNNCTNNPSSGGNSIIAGTQNTNSGIQGIVCGYQVQNSGNDSLVTGSSTVNTANDSILGGSSNNNSAKNSLVIGDSNTNTGQQSFISGSNNTVSSLNSAAIGSGNSVAGTHSAAFGSGNTINASSEYSFIAGSNNEIDTEPSADFSAIFGAYNKISSYGGGSFVAGTGNTTTGDCSLVAGNNNIVSAMNAAAFGAYNKDLDEGGEAYKFTIGDGFISYDPSDDEDEGTITRSNALSLDTYGNFKVKGDIENGTGDKLSEKADTTVLSGYATTTALALKADTSSLSSYATTSALSTLDSSAVKLTGTQTIAGTKTFSTIPRLSTTNVTPTLSYQVTSKSYVDAEIITLSATVSTKADSSDLSSYATTSDMNAALTLKANADFSNTNLFSSTDGLGGDFNDYTTDGIYKLWGSNTNSISTPNSPPISSIANWTLEVVNIQDGTAACTQRAYSINEPSYSYPIWIRNHIAGVWSDWYVSGGRSLIRSYSDTYNWYKIYMECPYGQTEVKYWCEQGGVVNATSSTATGTAAFLYPTSIYTNVQISPRNTSSTTLAQGYYIATGVSSTAFTWRLLAESNYYSNYLYWTACGYCSAP